MTGSRIRRTAAEAADIYAAKHIPNSAPRPVIDKAWEAMFSKLEELPAPRQVRSRRSIETACLDIRAQYGVPKKELTDWRKWGHVDESFYDRAVGSR